MNLLLDDSRVRLNYENLENRRIKPITIFLTEEEKELRRSQRFVFRTVPMIMMSQVRRAFYASRSRQQSSSRNSK